MSKPKKVDILGVEYRISYTTPADDPMLNDLYGYADSITKSIVIDKTDYEKIPDNKAHRKAVLRHEIVHAFLYESGLDSCSHSSKNWSIDEEIVDWIAIQTSKIYNVWKQLDIL